MTLNLLDHFLLGQISAFFLVFCRIGSGLMAMPGFSEVYVPIRIRLLFALALSIMLTPLLEARMPMLPGNPLALFVLLLGEVVIGLFLGLLVRTFLLVMHAAGNIIATQSSLAVAAAFDPTSANQSAVVGNLLSIAALTLFFALNFHHLMIAGLVDSYEVFTPGLFPNTHDMYKMDARLMADCFRLGVILAGPFIAYSLIFNLVGALMSRLMPNFQIFFVLMSGQIILALLIIFALLPTIMEVYAGFVEPRLTDLVSGGL